MLFDLFFQVVVLLHELLNAQFLALVLLKYLKVLHFHVIVVFYNLNRPLLRLLIFTQSLQQNLIIILKLLNQILLWRSLWLLFILKICGR